MRVVLASLKPYYYYLVGEGIKVLEIRKNMPKSNDWDKQVFFYMSKDEKSFAAIPKEYQEKYRKHFGKIGLKFVCDYIDELHEYELTPQGKHSLYEKAKLDLFIHQSCMDYGHLSVYRQNLPYYRPLYGWHITNLVIYDQPKELSEFINYNKHKICLEQNCFGADCYICPNNAIVTRPPQSYMYVEELD